MSAVQVEKVGKRIRVIFAFDREDVERIKSVSGRNFVSRQEGHGSAYWTVPADMTTCRHLRELFGKRLELGPELRSWAAREVETERNLGSLAAAETATLTLLPQRLPKLYEAIHTGPLGRGMTPAERAESVRTQPASYQAADVAFMAQAITGCGNFNHMGLGKTLELIAAIFEAGNDDGPNLVLAKRSTLRTVWETELTLWQDLPVYVATGHRSEREVIIKEACAKAANGEPLWLVVNPEMVSFTHDEMNHARDHCVKATPAHERSGKACRCPWKKFPHLHYSASYPDLFGPVWNTITFDECHASAIGNTKALKTAGVRSLSAKMKYALTGTPMGGRPLKLFGILQWLRPDVFTSKWTWADRYLVIEENSYGKQINDKLREGVEDAFHESLIPYVLRRTKDECLKWLPPKQYVNIWAEMTPKQAEQYKEWDALSEIKIDEEQLYGTSILAEYTRLRQFACARMTIRKADGKLIPTTDSGKLEHVERILTELGIMGEDIGDEQCVIFSQWTEVVEMLSNWLNDHHVANVMLTGKTSDDERQRLQQEFQSGDGPRVLIGNVKAGGVGINLDKASTVIFFDETWNPDDSEQAEDRCHRASRIHQVTIYYIRTKGTIEEDVFDDITGKQMTNYTILDERRKAKVNG